MPKALDFINVTCDTENKQTIGIDHIIYLSLLSLSLSLIYIIIYCHIVI
jgi:hypothetical protein